MESALPTLECVSKLEQDINESILLDGVRTIEGQASAKDLLIARENSVTQMGIDRVSKRMRCWPTVAVVIILWDSAWSDLGRSPTITADWELFWNCLAHWPTDVFQRSRIHSSAINGCFC